MWDRVAIVICRVSSIIEIPFGAAYRTLLSSLEEFAMANASFRPPEPLNEPVKSYAPGTLERTALKDALKQVSGLTTEVNLWINGQPAKSSQTINLHSPHRKSQIIARCQQANGDDIDLAISSAVRARKDWAALGWEDRAGVFLRAAELLATKYRYEMNAATMLGQSKTAHQAEIDAACELIDFFRFNVAFMKKIYDDQPISAPGTWNRSVARGLEGFVFAVTPFNFTSIAVNLPCAPALMGCSVIWKPAQTSMLACHVAMKLLKEAGLPDGVINMVSGDHTIIGDRVLAHKEFAGLHFTGSTPTFNHLYKTIANHLPGYRQYPRIVGETGGKDFVFVHESADAQEVVTALIRGAFEYQGQKCSAASRAYIPQSLWPKVREGLIATAESIKVGDPSDFSNFMGAVIDARAFKKISEYIDYAKSSPQAKVIAGGQCDDSEGYFIRPTIIETTDPHFKTMVEEIFGPVLTVFVYENNKFDDAVRLCESSSAYGLTGAIFARDRQVICRLTAELEHAAGNFYINDKPTGAVVGQQPFGGARASGTNDKAGSMQNLLRWVSMRTIKENFVPITDYRYSFMQQP
jgi:1-pyrroline-5-carboxylate dehydrogenase